MYKKETKFKQISATTQTTQQSITLQKAESEMQQRPYEISNYQNYPQRLISYIRTKAYRIDTKDENQKKSISMGTGCFIDENIVLTVGHNLIKYKQKLFDFEDKKKKYKDQTYLKQGLGDGKYIRKYKIEKMHFNPKYLPQQPQQKHFDQAYLDQIPQEEDYAILLVTPMPEQYQANIPSKEQKFMPIVMLSKQGLDGIKQFQIPGYPVTYNKDRKKNEDKSSCFMHEQIKTTGEFKPFQKNKIHYQAKNQKGFSGAPIIVQYEKEKETEKIIIAIHKGMNKQNKEGCGVSASSMIQQMNQWGYQLKKKPLIFTEKTLKLRGRQQEMNRREILYLNDLQLEAHDMLVYTSYDLSNLTSIFLTGNYIGEEGVQFLLRRNFPNLIRLFLTQNSIGDISVSEQSWKNLPILQILSLGGSNKLTTIPQGIVNLTKLTQLWLNKNRISKVPHTIIRQCFLNNPNNLSILIYENKIDFEAQKTIIDELIKQKLNIIWKPGFEQ